MALNRSQRGGQPTLGRVQCVACRSDATVKCPSLWRVAGYLIEGIALLLVLMLVVCFTFQEWRPKHAHTYAGRMVDAENALLDRLGWP